MNPGSKPRLVVGGDDVRRRRDVLEAADRDPKQLRDEPSEDAAHHPIEAWRVERVGVDERVERTGDKLPVLGACVVLPVSVRSRGRCGGRG